MKGAIPGRLSRAKRDFWATTLAKKFTCELYRMPGPYTHVGRMMVKGIPLSRIMRSQSHLDLPYAVRGLGVLLGPMGWSQDSPRARSWAAMELVKTKFLSFEEFFKISTILRVGSELLTVKLSLLWMEPLPP